MRELLTRQRVIEATKRHDAKFCRCGGCIILGEASAQHDEIAISAGFEVKDIHDRGNYDLMPGRKMLVFSDESTTHGYPGDEARIQTGITAAEITGPDITILAKNMSLVTIFNSNHIT